MGEVVSLKKSQVPAKLAAAFGGVEDNDDLIAGVQAGYAVVSIKGSKWRIKHAKEETLVTNAEGDPMPTLQVVLLKANPAISKNYYAHGYSDDSADAPDCFSIDGERPDAGVEDPVSPKCSICPKAVFGSRITDNGKKAKACADSRRVAIAPAQDIENELFDGAMLLRVPATSLADLQLYGKLMKEKGFPYQAVITKLGFDPDVSYPKLTFKPVRPLTDEEADKVLAQLASPKIESILQQPQDINLPDAEEEESTTVSSDFEEDGESAASTKPPATKKKRKKKAKTKAKPVAVEPDEAEEETEAATTEDESSDELDDELDDILGALDG